MDSGTATGTKASNDRIAYSLGGGTLCCLLIHGFTGLPEEMRPLAERLARGGNRLVEALRLPGHGNSSEELLATTRRDWLQAVIDRVMVHRQAGRRLILIGQSMGAWLSVAAAVHGDPVAAICLLAMPNGIPGFGTSLLFSLIAATPVKNWYRYYKKRGRDMAEPERLAAIKPIREMPITGIIELMALIDETRPLLATIKQPVLQIHSQRDRTAPFKGAAKIYQAIGAKQKRFVTLTRSGHILSADLEVGQIADEIETWLASCVGEV